MEICIWQGFCSEVNEMDEPQFCLELQCFFQTTESSLEMKAIKRILLRLWFVCYLCLVAAQKAGKRKGSSTVCVFTATTYRGHHWSTSLCSASFWNILYSPVLYRNISYKRPFSEPWLDYKLLFIQTLSITGQQYFSRYAGAHSSSWLEWWIINNQ